jgi:Amt family ammonium transporter
VWSLERERERETDGWISNLDPRAETGSEIQSLYKNLDANFLLSSAYLVFFMQAGFAMLCAGSVRSKNTKNILIKNVLDACVGALAWFYLGYGFAFGKPSDGTGMNSFIGSGNFAMKGISTQKDIAMYLFQWSFSAAATTIVSGSVAERTKFEAYLGYSFFLCAFVYPVVVHWGWSGEGWLGPWRSATGDGGGSLLAGSGMLDFAGSGIVHMTGGVAGLVGAAIVGPRTGRFAPDGRVNPMPGHSAPLVVLGTFILWLGWYGFNPGSQLALVSFDDAASDNARVIARTAVTTTLAAAGGGVGAMALNYYLYHVWDLIAVCNGCLAGLVGITAGCSTTEPWAAPICGALSALVIHFSSKLLLKLQIDDPLEAAPMHGFCGAFGVLWVGFMAKKEYVAEVFGTARNGYEPAGVFYGGNGKLLGAQIVGILVITAWVGTMLGGFFFLMKKMNLLRTTVEEENLGLDESKHGGSAYSMELVVPEPVDGAA